MSLCFYLRCRLARSRDCHMLAPLHSLTKSETIASESQDVGMMDQSIDERGCQTIVAKYLVPLTELQIGCHNYTPSLITIGNYVE